MAAEDMLPSAKRRKYSKNKKKNWRKFTNVKDVNEFLDETRREERTGGIAAEKEDSDLFFEEKDPATSEDQPVTTRKKKPLRSESNLYLNTSIPPISVPLRRKYKRLKERKIGMEGETSSEEEYDNASFREKLKQQWKLKSTIQRRKYQKMKEEISARELKDLWIGDDHKEQQEEDDFYLTVTCKKSVKKPCLLGKMPSALQSVEPPHPGASYNPTFIDHQELLGNAVKVEEAQIAALQALDKRVQLAEMDHKERKQVWMTEMSEGLPKPPGSGENDSEVEEEESDEDCPLLKRPVRAEDRKTRKQRRKARELKEAEHLRKFQKQNKATMNEVYRIKSIKKNLRNKEEQSKIKMLHKEHLKQLDPYRTKRLGKQPFEEPEIAVKLSTELIGSLRALKPEGSLLVDRYKSLQKRNMIVPKGPRASAKERKRNQPKVRVVEKRSVEPVVTMKT